MSTLALMLALGAGAALTAYGAVEIDAQVHGIGRARRGALALGIAGVAVTVSLLATGGAHFLLLAAPLALLAFAGSYVAGAARLVRVPR